MKFHITKDIISSEYSTRVLYRILNSEILCMRNINYQFYFSQTCGIKRNNRCSILDVACPGRYGFYAEPCPIKNLGFKFKIGVPLCLDELKSMAMHHYKNVAMPIIKNEQNLIFDPFKYPKLLKFIQKQKETGCLIY